VHLKCDVRKTGHRSKVRMCLAQADIPKRLMEVRCDLPDFICRMLAAERRSGNQIFAHRQSPDDDGFETHLSDETRRDIHSVRVVAGDRNSDEFALPVRVRRQLGGADRIERCQAETQSRGKADIDACSRSGETECSMRIWRA